LFLIVWFALQSEVWKKGFDWRIFSATFGTLRWDWLALGALLALATYYGRALRWAVLIRPVKPHPAMRNLLSATVIGFTAITLLGRPGEFVRPYLISAKEQVPFSSQLAAWMLERIYDLLVALLVFGFALSQVRQSGIQAGPRLAWVLEAGGWFVAVTALTTLVILLLIRHYSESMKNRLLAALGFLSPERFAKVERLVTAFVQGVESTRNRKSVLLLTGYTVLEWVVIAACTYCVMKAFGSAVQFGWIDVLIFLGFGSFGALIQIPGVGGGVQVVSVLILTELFSLPFEVAASVAVTIWIITFVIVVPIGIVFALHEGVHWSRLRQVGREVAS